VFASTAPLTVDPLVLAGRLSDKEPLAIKRVSDVNATDPSNCVVASLRFQLLLCHKSRDLLLASLEVSETLTIPQPNNSCNWVVACLSVHLF
jgi:hypothetical protein